MSEITTHTQNKDGIIEILFPLLVSKQLFLNVKSKFMVKAPQKVGRPKIVSKRIKLVITKRAMKQ